MQVGFAVIGRPGEMECRLFGQRLGDPLPLVTYYQAAGGAAVLLGRLYYREERVADLLPRLSEGHAESYRSNDAALALATYACLGWEGLTRLEGDFALVIWDERENQLLGMRDPLGGYPLFWAHCDGGVAFSSSLRPLLGLLSGRRVDSEYVADYLIMPGSSHAEMPAERCAFEGIRRVLAGTIVELRSAAASVERHRYWDWQAGLEDLRGADIGDLAERLAGLLRPAVRERVRGLTAAQCSGGMDSTAIALLTRDWVRASGGAAPLHTVSLAYSRLPNLSQERPYLDCALMQGGFEPHLIEADDLLEFDTYLAPPDHEEPCPMLHALGIHRAMAAAAAQAGVRTLLTGQGADDLFDVAPYHLTDLLRRGRFRAVWAEAARWARAGNTGMWRVLYPYGLANLLPACVRPGWGTLWRWGYAPWKKQNDYTIPPWIRPAYARRHGLRDRAVEHARRACPAGLPAGLGAALAGLSVRVGDVTRWHLAPAHGMTVAQPFLDPRVMRLGLSLQAAPQAPPDRQKPVLALAMHDVLPPLIRDRRDKGDFNEIFFLGLSRNLTYLEALVRRAPFPDPDCLDREVLLSCLQQAALGIAGDASGQDRLNLTLSLLRWSALQEECPPQEGPPTMSFRCVALGPTVAGSAVAFLTPAEKA